jgi:hypothetical protein
MAKRIICGGNDLSEYRSKEMQMIKLNQELVYTILQEINTCLQQGVLPLHDDYLKHLSETGDILEYLLFMKNERLIGGALVTRGINNTPHRITNICLTNLGRRALHL